jgi:archaellum biogenesis protein FlaJ (TadC family)
MTDILGWVREHQLFFQVLGLTSLALLLASVVIFPLVVAYLPRDYFVRDRRDPTRRIRRRPLLWVVLTVLKNLTGLVLILAGLAMLVLPGQGILTILMGLALTNFPGKYRLERWLVRRPAVGRGLNRIRRVAGKDRLEIPSEE